ncbi:MAG TPA: hypothetical protein VMN35_08480 [Gaiellaceae bacterium]|nr:hypothetical protein [Gaiellaceae bacterium]
MTTTAPDEGAGGRTTIDVRYPEVEVELIGHDGNAFSVLGRVSRALREAGVEESEVEEFVAEATAGDYDHLLATVMRWVEVT